MTPEGRVKEKVKAALKAHGAYYHMPVQNGLGAPSLDFIGCHQGLYFGIETKAADKQPTPRQRITMDSIEKSRGKTFLINEATGVDYLLDWLTRKE